MYLSDNELSSLLPKLDVKVSEGSPAFDPTEQIQPASIDLRLGNMFWIPQYGRRPLDLRRSYLLRAEPRRYYRRQVFKQKDSIKLRPGQLLLARTCEKFTIPDGYVAEITGRSSFARLGLMVNCTGGFINPGWRGHMTLQLVNMGEVPLYIFPHLPICQLRIAALSSNAAQPYGHAALHSKYVEDDGGPSYWWRDKSIAKLHAVLNRVDPNLATLSKLMDMVKAEEPEVLDRLESHLEKKGTFAVENAESILDEFAASEGRRKWRISALRGLGLALLPIVASTTLASYFASPSMWTQIGLWSGSAASLLVFIVCYRHNVGRHLTKAELHRLRSQTA
jgi:deoxycytidine triphosphate deaminase